MARIGKREKEIEVQPLREPDPISVPQEPIPQRETEPKKEPAKAWSSM